MSTGHDARGEAAILRKRITDLEDQLARAREALRRLETGAQEMMPGAVVSRVRSAGEVGLIDARSSSAEKLAVFRARFAGRDDVYALRWVSRRTGKRGWSPAVRGGFYTDASTDAAACGRAGIGALAEISRSDEGAHVWVFFDEPVQAAAARARGATLQRAAMVERAAIALSSYDRFFPAQDTLPERSPGRLRLGNLIALPLQGDCRRRGTTVFADPVTWEPFADQFAALVAVEPVRAARLEEFAGTPLRLRAGPLEQLAARPRRSAIRAGAKHVAGRSVGLRRDAMVHVPLDGLPGVVVTELKHVASVSNPEFYRRQAQRFSTFGVPRLVTCFELDETELRIPRGLLDEAKAVLVDAGFAVDARIDADVPAAFAVRFEGELREDQRAAVDALLGYDTGVLVAPPGAGKTVMACALIAERGVPTAILVNRAELLQQWRTRLVQFLSITEKQSTSERALLGGADRDTVPGRPDGRAHHDAVRTDPAHH